MLVIQAAELVQVEASHTVPGHVLHGDQGGEGLELGRSSRYNHAGSALVGDLSPDAGRHEFRRALPEFVFRRRHDYSVSGGVVDSQKLVLRPVTLLVIPCKPLLAELAVNVTVNPNVAQLLPLPDGGAVRGPERDVHEVQTAKRRRLAVSPHLPVAAGEPEEHLVEHGVLVATHLVRAQSLHGAHAEPRRVLPSRAGAESS